MSPAIARRVVELFRQVAPAAGPAGPAPALTPAERRLLALLVEGLRYQECADRLSQVGARDEGAGHVAEPGQPPEEARAPTTADEPGDESQQDEVGHGAHHTSRGECGS